jgi:predicted N-acetyltransferase YhbS
VFITKATRHDRADIAQFLAANGFGGGDVARGATFFARDGGVIGSIRLVEVEPGAVVVDDMVVAAERRRQGIGTSLVRAAMNSRGGALFVRCPSEHRPFFESVGFATVPEGDLPGAVRDYLGARDHLDGPPGGPDRLFMKAR